MLNKLVTNKIMSLNKLFAYNLFIAINIIILIRNVEAARILGIAPMPTHSHQVVFTTIWQALAQKGHELVVITPEPTNDTRFSNIIEIDVSSASNNVYYKVERHADNGYNFLKDFVKLLEDLQNAQLDHIEIQKLISGKENFDLVMYEHYFPVYASFAKKFNCPLIAVSSMDVTPQILVEMGNPQHYVINPNFILPFYQNLNLLERVISVLMGIIIEPYLMHEWYQKCTSLTYKYFGYKQCYAKGNVDMLFVNTNPIFGTTKPTVPAVVYFGGGIHIKPPEPLPEDIQEFLDRSSKGVVFISLGITAENTYDLEYINTVFVDVLSELMYDVLWKFTGAVKPKVGDNVKLIKWAPQQDVLRHNKVKAFITQCGLQSMEEAIYSHTPIIAIPLMGDQFRNARMISELEIGIEVNKKEITKDGLKIAILEVIESNIFKQKIRALAKLSKDVPMTGIEQVVWWTEHVIRNNGAKHLRSALLDLPFYQYYMLDVIGVVGFFILLFLYVIVKSSKYFYVCVKSLFKRKIKRN